jgi:SAM-dependent methyltransferase
MNDWTHGYVADIDYTYNFFKELAPAHLAFALLAKGFRPPPCDEKFSYCEIGFGQGVTINLFAAANPLGDFWGTDFNPSHAAGATLLAKSAQSRNLTLYDRSFEEFIETDTAQFDFIALHGVYSWVSPENRRNIVEIIKRKLKCGGAVYLSYNTLPGWSAVMPLRELMQRHAALSTEPTAARVEKALAFAKRVADSKANYFLANPGTQQHLGSMMDQNRRYLAHEYFNSDWNPQYFSEVSAEMAAAKVVWVASARLEEDIPTLTLTPEAQKLLGEIGDPNLRETVRDYCNNTRFRRDVFVKGPLKLHPREQAELMGKVRFALIVNRKELKLSANYGNQEVSLAPAVYNALADALAKEPQTLDQLMSHADLRREGLARVAQAVCVLVATEQASPCLAPDDEDRRRASCDRFNAVVLDRARYSDEIKVLASPVTGSGHVVNRIDLLFLGALRRNVDPVKDAWEILDSQGQRLVKGGKALTTAEENRAELESRAVVFREETLPLARKLKVA